MKKISLKAVLLLVLAFTIGTAYSQKIKAAVPQLSPASTEIYKQLCTAVLEAAGYSTDIQIMPFARVLYSVETKTVDMGSATVAIPDTKKWSTLTYDYSTSEVLSMVFVLYTNKSKNITAAEILKGNPKKYKLETDVAHTNHFNFSISGSTSFEASLRKVDSGDIDGYIFAQPSADGVVRSLNLKNIKRQYYASFPAYFLLPKGNRGGKLDKDLTAGLAKIKANGKYTEILGAYLGGAAIYIDWQP